MIDNMDVTETQGTLHQRLVVIFNDVFQEEFGIDTADIRRSDVAQWDSVNHLRLVLELEQEFGITLSDDDVLAIGSLSDAEAVLTRLGA